MFCSAQASDREQFNHILNDRTHKGVGHIVGMAFESMGQMMHHSPVDDADGDMLMQPSTSAKSIGRLFNPFRSKAAPAEAHTDSSHGEHRRHHKKHGDGGSGNNSVRSTGENKLKSRSIERHPSDGAASVPTIELGSGSESYDVNMLTTLGQ